MADAELKKQNCVDDYGNVDEKSFLKNLNEYGDLSPWKNCGVDENVNDCPCDKILNTYNLDDDGETEDPCTAYICDEGKTTLWYLKNIPDECTSLEGYTRPVKAILQYYFDVPCGL